MHSLALNRSVEFGCSCWIQQSGDCAIFFVWGRIPRMGELSLKMGQVLGVWQFVETIWLWAEEFLSFCLFWFPRNWNDYGTVPHTSGKCLFKEILSCSYSAIFNTLPVKDDLFRLLPSSLAWKTGIIYKVKKCGTIFSSTNDVTNNWITETFLSITIIRWMTEWVHDIVRIRLFYAIVSLKSEYRLKYQLIHSGNLQQLIAGTCWQLIGRFHVITLTSWLSCRRVSSLYFHIVLWTECNRRLIVCVCTRRKLRRIASAKCSKLIRRTKGWCRSTNEWPVTYV